jgi:TRAP-type C4-dicarboxylate transport system permease small subunit
MILVVGVQILTRWVLSPVLGSLPWTVNLSGMLLVWVTFLGAAVASRKREHISLDLLVSRLSDGTIRVLTGFRTVIIIVFVSVMIAGAYPLYQANREMSVGALPTYPPFTQGWLYVAAVVGGLLIVVYGLRDLWLAVMSPDVILEDLKRDDEHDG